MEPLLILIVIPSIAYLMLRIDSMRSNGLDSQTRESSRNLLPLITLATWIIGMLFLILGIRDFPLRSINYADFFVSMARFGIGFGLFYLGWKAWQVSKHREQADLPLRDILQRDIEATSARTAAFVFILLPLALPAMIGVCTLGFIPIIIYSFGTQTQRIMQNQLLWTLALAIKNDMNLALEIQSLANSYERKRTSVPKIMMWTIGTLIGMGFLALLAVVVQLLLIVAVVLLTMLIMMLAFRKWKRRQMLDSLRSLAAALYDGTPLADALSRYPGMIPSEVVGAIESASETGDVGEVLSKIAFEDSRTLEQRNLMGGSGANAAIYVVLIVTILFNVVGFIMYWIIPKYKELFQDFGMELPPITEAWISAADFFANYWYVVGPVVFLPLLPLAIGSMFLLDDMTWIPGFVKRIFPRIEAPSLLKRLGYVTSNNMQLQPSLISLANSTVEIGISRRIERLENRLELGDALGTSLRDEGFVNVREAYSIDNATQTGHLGWALIAIANSIQQRRIDRMRWVMEMTRPLVIIFLAVIVASFCVAMFLPLVELIGDLS